MSYFEKIQKLSLSENPVILGIETSCDDTAAAVVCQRKILSSEIVSSAAKHIEFGGIVPEIASRAHTDAVSFAVEHALKNANLSLAQIDGIAVTYGAGLLGSLLVGVSYAKALAFAINKPLIPVSHIRGHIAASYLADENLQPPFICLLASGGHTAVLHIKTESQFELLGSTADDAAGEAFDKIARALGLPYPGGPSVEKLAAAGKDNIKLPKMLKADKNSFNFSYSGLKTAVLNYLNTSAQNGQEVNKADVAASFQKAAIGALVERAIRASIKTDIKKIAVGGGVAANGYLRQSLTAECEKHQIELFLPNKSLCTDNAAMIAMEGQIQYKLRNFADLSLNAKARVGLI